MRTRKVLLQPREGGARRPANEQASGMETKLPRNFKYTIDDIETMESVLALSAVIGPEVDKQIHWLQSK